MTLPRLPIGTIFPCLFLALVSIPAAPAQPAARLPLYPGLEMTANVDKTVCKVGEPVVLRVNIRNATHQVIVLGNGAGERHNFIFLVRNKAGNALPLTPYGRHLQTGPRMVAQWLIKVAAGQTRGYHIDLTPMFGLQTPGEYSVVVSRRVIKENDRSAAHGQYQIIAKPVFFTVQATH